MKRMMLTVVGCIILSIALYSVAVYVSLQFSAWGEYNSQPPENRPPVSVALASKRSIAILFYVAVLPVISMVVGVLASRSAPRPGLVATCSMLPLQLFYLVLDGLTVFPILSFFADVSLALGTATLLHKLKVSRTRNIAA